MSDFPHQAVMFIQSGDATISKPSKHLCCSCVGCLVPRETIIEMIGILVQHPVYSQCVLLGLIYKKKSHCVPKIFLSPEYFDSDQRGQVIIQAPSRWHYITPRALFPLKLHLYPQNCITGITLSEPNIKLYDPWSLNTGPMRTFFHSKTHIN